MINSKRPQAVINNCIMTVGGLISHDEGYRFPPVALVVFLMVVIPIVHVGPKAV